jgi:hypothetical protein
MWPNDVRRVVLLHELAHVARRDCLTQTAAAFVCALYWIHPGSWWLARRLRIERELACDDLVLSTGTDAGDYAGHLLELAYSLRGHVIPVFAVGMAAPRQLEARLRSLLDRARNRTVPTPRGRALALAVLVASIVPLAAAAVGAPPGGRDAPAPDAPLALESGSEWFQRFLTVEYWRQTAANELTRLAEQLDYLSEMRQLGYSMTDVDVLFKLRQHGVTPSVVRDLAAEGLSGLSSDDLLTAVSHGISAEYVHQLKGLGYRPLDLETLVRLRSHGIDADFIRDLDAVGFSKPSIDDLIRARSHGISANNIRELHELGYPHLTLDHLTLFCSHGVGPDYIRELQALEYVDLTPEQLASLRSHGVTSDQIKGANLSAGVHLSVVQLNVLASHGWK